MNIEKNNDLTRRSILKVTFLGLFVYNIKINNIQYDVVNSMHRGQKNGINIVWFV